MHRAEILRSAPRKVKVSSRHWRYGDLEDKPESGCDCRVPERLVLRVALDRGTVRWYTKWDSGLIH